MDGLQYTPIDTTIADGYQEKQSSKTTLKLLFTAAALLGTIISLSVALHGIVGLIAFLFLTYIAWRITRGSNVDQDGETTN